MEYNIILTKIVLYSIINLTFFKSKYNKRLTNREQGQLVYIRLTDGCKQNQFYRSSN